MPIPFVVGDYIVGEGEEEVSSPSEADSSYQGTVSNIRYNHMAYPWDSPLSFGVQAFIEYNGLIMNDRYRSDVIRVTSISGLDDAEVRDSREPKASAHGEYAYDAFYGGRNLVLNGFFEAGSLPVKNYLEKTLRAAFAPLEESQLKFRWFDITDTFDDPNSILEYKPTASLARPSGNYTALIGSNSNFKIQSGLVEWLNTGHNILVRSSEQRTFCDAQATLGFIVGSETETKIEIVMAVKDENNYISFVYDQNGAFPNINIYSKYNGHLESFIPGGESVSDLAGILKLGQQIWLRGKKEGNLLTVELYNKEPEENELPFISGSYYLTGEEANIFGDKILSQVGFGGIAVDTDWKLSEFKVESLYPGDIEFKARKLSSISIKDEQTSMTKFKRAFQIPMRTSDFRAFNSTQSRKSIIPSASDPTLYLGRKYPRTYPLSYRSFTSSNVPLNENILYLHNRGTVFVEPILYIYGPGENIYLNNLTNSLIIEWFGEIKENDYIVIDCKEETIVNSLGINYLEPLSANSEYIKLDPGWNEIYISGSGFTSSTKVMSTYKHGFI